METLSFSFPSKFINPSWNATVKQKRLKQFTPNCSFNPFQPLNEIITKQSSSKIPRKSNQPFLQKLIFKPLDDFTGSLSNFDPKQVLSGSWSPVANELPPTPCRVANGSLPPCLDGAYIQNGPNPQFTPRGAYHLVDGDGMLHAVRISGGTATYCRRYVRTYKFLIERALGFPVFPNVFADFNSSPTLSALLTVALAVTGHLNPVRIGLGTANTAISLIGKTLFALCESDLPYAVRVTPDGDITTLGRRNLHDNGRNFLNMTAHPKIDRQTGEAFAFRYHMVPPFLTFFRIDSGGRKRKDVPINSMKVASFIHDFAVTENYALFPDPQIVLNPREITRGRSVMGIDADKVPRLGIMPKYAEDDSEMLWIDAPGLNIVHFFNAWEEDDGATIVFLASNLSPIDYALRKMDSVHLSIEKIRIDVKGKKVVRDSVSSQSLDFGTINPEYAGKKNQYLYAAAMETMPKVAGVVKLDLTAEGGDCVVASRMYGTGCSGSEPIFVANSPATAEDDGYLLAYVHDDNTGASQLLVMDSKSRDLEIVAAVELPGRVPSGFHSIFVKEADLQQLWEGSASRHIRNM